MFVFVMTSPGFLAFGVAGVLLAAVAMATAEETIRIGTQHIFHLRPCAGKANRCNASAGCAFEPFKLTTFVVARFNRFVLRKEA